MEEYKDFPSSLITAYVLTIRAQTFIHSFVSIMLAFRVLFRHGRDGRIDRGEWKPNHMQMNKIFSMFFIWLRRIVLNRSAFSRSNPRIDVKNVRKSKMHGANGRRSLILDANSQRIIFAFSLCFSQRILENFSWRTERCCNKLKPGRCSHLHNEQTLSH